MSDVFSTIEEKYNGAVRQKSDKPDEAPKTPDIDYRAAYEKEKLDHQKAIHRLEKAEFIRREQMTEAEIMNEELSERAAEQDKALKEYQDRERFTNTKSQFLALGYSEAAAVEATKAFIAGDIKSMFTQRDPQTDQHFDSIAQKYDDRRR